MSRKTILILLGILIVGLGIWVFIESNKSPSGTDGTSDGKGIFGTLFPFGSGSGTTPDGTETPGPDGEIPDGTPQEPTTSNNRLTQIVNTATAGFTILIPPVIKPTPGEPVVPTPPKVRYVASGTGYVHDIGVKGGTPVKMSGTVIARTAQALFGDNGETVIFRYIKTDGVTIATYLGRIVPNANLVTTGSVTGKFLADGILDVVMSPDKKSFLFLTQTDTGSVAATMKTDGTGQKQVFASPFSEWLLDWSALGTVITTKADSSVSGYAYQVASNGVMTRIVGGEKGLTTKMSPDGKSVLYSVSLTSGLSLRVKNLKDGTDVNTGLSTLPEKCTWSSDSKKAYCGATGTLDGGSYPENWYQGIAHFNDALWSVDPVTGSTTQLNDGEGNYLDVVNLAIDSKGTYLVFINKNNGSLWSYEL